VKSKTVKVKLGGKKWAIVSTSDLPNLWGLNMSDEKVILLNSTAKPKQALDTAIHEAIHGTCPWMEEGAVAEMGTELCNALWKLGYRKVK